MRSLRVLAGVAVALAITQCVFALSARAKTCTASSHCYGIVQNNSGAIVGVSVEIDPSNSCFYAPAGAFVTAETWLADFHAGDARGPAWIEAGYIDNQGANIDGVTKEHTSLFWGQQVPDGSFHGHQYLVGATGLTRRLFEIDRHGSGTWDVYLDGVGWVMSIGNIMNPDVGQYGAEATANASGDYSRFDNVAYHSGNTDTWANGVYNRSTLSQSPPMAFGQFGDYTYNYLGGIPC